MIGIRADLSAGQLTVSRNGVQESTFSGLPRGRTFYPFVAMDAGNDKVEIVREDL